MNNIKQIQAKLQETKQTVENLNTQIKSLEKQLKQAEIEGKSFKRLDKHQIYHQITTSTALNGEGGKFTTGKSYDDYDFYSNGHFNNNNYYLTKERAQEVADKINLLLRLERLHDELCLDYVPNWKDGNECKYYIIYDNKHNVYKYDYVNWYSHIFTVYFPTLEIAEKVCNMLNEELKNDGK